MDKNQVKIRELESIVRKLYFISKASRDSGEFNIEGSLMPWLNFQTIALDKIIQSSQRIYANIAPMLGYINDIYYFLPKD